MYSRKELIEWATIYANYCASVRANQMLPMDFEDFLEKKEVVEKKHIESKIDEVIEFLNTTAQTYGKRGFQLKGKKIRSLIRTKLKEGFDVSDFIDVISVKSAWLADKAMHKYFRPTTLFGNKFEDYLNETTQPIEQNNTEDEYAEAIRRAATDNY
tara:strand:+ start:5377 stop:5844 length:468 start_codon:yes stop_codon:yes gene_type:complete